jgi:biotin transport system substrate-specific component
MMPARSLGLARTPAIFNQFAVVLCFSLVLALSAKVQVPFWPVPITMQSMVVMLIGIFLGPRLGALAIGAYLAEGLAGLPVFAGAAAGPAYLIGPTGGYLFGFLLSGAFAGWVAKRGFARDLPGALLIMVLGHIILFVPGVIWLAALFGWSKAFAFGIVPFMAATLLKSGLGAAIVAALYKVADALRTASR